MQLHTKYLHVTDNLHVGALQRKPDASQPMSVIETFLMQALVKRYVRKYYLCTYIRLVHGICPIYH